MHRTVHNACCYANPPGQLPHAQRHPGSGVSGGRRPQALLPAARRRAGPRARLLQGGLPPVLPLPPPLQFLASPPLLLLLPLLPLPLPLPLLLLTCVPAPPCRCTLRRVLAHPPTGLTRSLCRCSLAAAIVGPPAAAAVPSDERGPCGASQLERCRHVAGKCCRLGAAGLSVLQACRLPSPVALLLTLKEADLALPCVPHPLVPPAGVEFGAHQVVLVRSMESADHHLPYHPTPSQRSVAGTHPPTVWKSAVRPSNQDRRSSCVMVAARHSAPSASTCGGCSRCSGVR